MIITLCGCTFNVVESAYDRLSGYIDSIKRRFADTDGGDDIIADIEARIAELLYEASQKGERVVTGKMVDDVMERMGDFGSDSAEGAQAGQSQGETEAVSGGTRSLYRRKSEGKVAGVCYGLATYFGVDPLFVRVLFIIFMGIIPYVVLWVILKDADTPMLQRRMEGSHPSIDAFWQKFDAFFDGVQAKFKALDNTRRVIVCLCVGIFVMLIKSHLVMGALAALITFLFFRAESRTARLIYMALFAFVLVLKLHYNFHIGNYHIYSY